MEFGIAVVSQPDSWKVAKRAEELGFSDVWFYDSQLLYTDVFVSMALAAEHTETIRLGTGVLIPSNRIAPVTANALASLNRLAPGRIKWGVGTGFTGRRTMGQRAIKLADFRAYLDVVLGMLDGKTVEADLDGESHKVRFLNPEIGLIDIDSPIDLAISAFGPKARKVVADYGAEWCNFGGPDPRAIAALDDMKAAWQEAGHPGESLRAVEFTLGCVLEEGEPYDSARAKDQAGTLPAAAIHGIVEDPGFAEVMEHTDPTLQAALARYREIWEDFEPDARYLRNHTGHLLFLKPEERDLIGPELLAALTLTGTEPQIRERVEQFGAAGYTQLAVQLVPGHESAIEDWARVFGLSN